MSILVVVENVVVSRTNLREKDLVVTRLDSLVAGLSIALCTPALSYRGQFPGQRPLL